MRILQEDIPPLADRREIVHEDVGEGFLRIAVAVAAGEVVLTDCLDLLGTPEEL